MGGRQVVEQHAVRHLARQPQHALVQRADHDPGPALAQPHPQAEAGDPVEVAFEVDALAGQALAHQPHVLPHLGQRPPAVASPVPAPCDHGRGDAHAQDDLPLGGQSLQRGSRHGQQRRRAQLEGQHPGAQVEAGRGLRDRSQRGEGLGPGRLGHPERPEPQGLGPTRRLHRELEAQALEAGRGEADGGRGTGHAAGTVAEGAAGPCRRGKGRRRILSVAFRSPFQSPAATFGAPA